eukprot:Nitzschia sp. Nitz4//scaffold1_size375055//46068//47321//NITZ4_000219-RA/size375055-processed-gene-0.410-mRNA-1//-1//CDS//3329540874//2188//frame0
MAPKRLSMSGMVVPLENEGKEQAESGHSRDATVDTTSHSSMVGDNTSIPLPPVGASTPPRIVVRRRSSCGNSSVSSSGTHDKHAHSTMRRRRASVRKESIDEAEDVDDSISSSVRFGNAEDGALESPAATPTKESELQQISEDKPSSIRRMFFGMARRRSSGSTSLSLQDSPSVRSEVESPSISSSRSRGVDRTKSADANKPKPSPQRGMGLRGTKSFNATEGRLRSLRNAVKSDDSSVTDSLCDSTRKPSSLRRSFFGGSSDSVEKTPDRPRRHSATGKPQSLRSPNADEASIRSSSRHTHCSTQSIKSVTVKPHDLVNKSRAKRGLPEFSRNMLMDTIAMQVAHDLAASNGTKCTPTSYHGNVGQGETVKNIHRTMMSQKGGTARANILASQFSEMGVAMARGKDGMIYMCQLFK